jgi:hypothetical protein
MKLDDAGHYVADVKLAEGPHSYRFFVDGAWVNDSEQHSEADLEESNGIRGHNSAVVVGPDGRNLPKLQPGRIAVEGLHYVPGNIRYFDPYRGASFALYLPPRREISRTPRCIRWPDRPGGGTRCTWSTHGREWTSLVG